MKAKFLVLAMVLGLLSVRLQAGTTMPIIDNPLQPTNAGEFSNLGASNQQIADDFVLSQPVTLQSISWFGRYSSDLVNITGPVSFSVRFFDDNGDQPAISPFLTFDLAASVAGAGSAFSGVECATANCPWFSYSASLPDILLGPAKYWVSVLETDSRTALFGNSQWLWADTDSTGLRSFRFSDGSAWTTTSDINHAFTLSGTVTSTVPEPATLSLLAAGLLVGAAFRKRFK